MPLTDIKIKTITDFPHIKKDEMPADQYKGILELLASIERRAQGVYECVGFNPDVHTDDIENCGNVVWTAATVKQRGGYCRSARNTLLSL